MTALDVGIFLPTMSGPGERLGDVAAAARHAEELGFESVWAVDQLVAGSGAPFVDSTVALAAAAAVTSRVRLGFGVLVLPLHPVVWVAKQVASLQHVSGDRVILGVGVGGDRHEQAWIAAGVPRRERGRRTDDALGVLPGLLAGKPTQLADDGPAIQLAPGVSVPPIVVGGMSEAALVRAATYGDGWFPLPVAPADVAAGAARLAELAAARGRPAPDITASLMTVLLGDPSGPDAESLVRILTDVDGKFGVPADQAADLAADLLAAGDRDSVAARLAGYAAIGARRVVVSFAAGDWHRQAELLAEARAQLP